MLKNMRDIAQANQFKCTVVSILPYTLREPKPGLNPGEFVIPACEDVNKPTCLVVSEGTYGIYLDGDRGTLRARTPSTEVARSVFEDYISSQLAVEPDAKPGLFALPGVVKTADFENDNELKELLELMIQQQNNWFNRLVKLGDDIWNRYHQHGAITDLMRYAARALGVENLDWMKVSQNITDLTRCPACRGTVDSQAIICSSCGCVLNADAYEKLQFAGKPSSLKTSLLKANQQPTA
jgi:hypothetical protein